LQFIFFCRWTYSTMTVSAIYRWYYQNQFPQQAESLQNHKPLFCWGTHWYKFTQPYLLIQPRYLALVVLSYCQTRPILFFHSQTWLISHFLTRLSNPSELRNYLDFSLVFRLSRFRQASSWPFEKWGFLNFLLGFAFYFRTYLFRVSAW